MEESKKQTKTTSRIHGFPIIGETFEFMKPHDALQFSTFVKDRTFRHGPVFRTSLFGAKVIISTDVELNMEIAKTSHVPGVTKSIARLFGENNLFVQSKESHKHVRSLTSQLLGTHSLKSRMIQDIDILACTHMKEGARNGVLDVKETASKVYILSVSSHALSVCLDNITTNKKIGGKRTRTLLERFSSSWFQFSFNVPGTGVYRMMKARNKMMKLLKESILKKRASGEEFGEFFKTIFGETGKEMMSIENAIEYIYTFFLVANETRHGFLRLRTEKEAGLTWEDYKSMTFTQMVINESLRITSTFPTVLRVTDHDVQVGDYTIPEGWTFMGYANVHFNPENYDDPLVFNPWRWEGKDLGAILTKTYIPFGAGARLCVGAELAKLVMSIFIHHLYRYRWSMKAETKVIRRYMLMFPHGCDVQISDDTEVDKSAYSI
ncbi:unnamed protein product [Microthlaspi erraticum]|uniref:Cytochrome P450 n=1 Tax=Microthlaspi erraticum TaxID=1685480 RepID=A0A6D2HVL7_9BRAS|nr:unnamed protein product [Microthlaspi erraticum]